MFWEWAWHKRWVAPVISGEGEEWTMGTCRVGRARMFLCFFLKCFLISRIGWWFTLVYRDPKNSALFVFCQPKWPLHGAEDIVRWWAAPGLLSPSPGCLRWNEGCRVPWWVHLCAGPQLGEAGLRRAVQLHLEAWAASCNWLSIILFGIVLSLLDFLLMNFGCFILMELCELCDGPSFFRLR